jgi:hypothetical protein
MTDEAALHRDNNIDIRLIQPEAGQSPINKLETALVGLLVNDVVESLTDRAGGDHPHPWTPQQKVRIGYLAYTITPPPPTDGSTSGDDEPLETPSLSTPAGVLPASAPRPIDNHSVIGFDFVVNPSEDELTLDCKVDYAMYQMLWPDLSTLQEEARAALVVSSRRTSPVSGTTSDQLEDGDTELEDTGDGPRTADTSSRPARRRPSVRVRPTWRRYDRSVRLQIVVDLTDLDEMIVSSRDIPGGDPLLEDASLAVSTHYALHNAARKLAQSQTLAAREAAEDLATVSAALNRRLDASWAPARTEPELTVIAVPTTDGQVAVSVSLVNRTEVDSAPFQDLALYDASVDVAVIRGGVLESQRLGFAHDDPRYSEAATVGGRGRGCVARTSPDQPGHIWSDALPIYVQPHTQPADVQGANLKYESMAGDPRTTLNSIILAMEQFERNWTNPTEYEDDPAFFEKLQRQFHDEVSRFELGCDLLQKDPDLALAFCLANKAFARANPEPDSGWRLFQLVFIVSQLAGIAVRRNPEDQRLRAELDAVDVLWFPTGGGKTEAYLGLIATALFFDRLRGKHRGTTAWLLFPLRMLSVQQLARMEKVLHNAEEIRVQEGIPGDSFTLGYLVGSNNTPNKLTPYAQSSWWPGLASFSSWSQAERDLRRLVGACSNCGNQDSVGLDTDLTGQRLLHVCRECGHVLAIHASDEEVFRYLSSVIVSTVDKMASFAYNGEFTSFNHGPKHYCPSHGYYSFGGCRAVGCSLPDAGVPEFLDPTPALWIQDELHLVREELGVFASHYHTLLAELSVHAGHLPSKILTATATIEQYEDQLRQVYGRRPRMFPTGGPTLSGSFYTRETGDVRRVYLGIMPAGGGTAKVDLAGQLQSLLIERIHMLTDSPDYLQTYLASKGIDATIGQILDSLFNYELTLGYVNNKTHGVNILDDIHSLSDLMIHKGTDRIVSEFLSGETPIGELARVVAAVTGATRTSVKRSERYRALVGTSVVSHGIDLARLNLQVVAGMPSSYAHYIQATSRAGRSHVGLVVSVFDRFNRREMSVFHSFLTSHRALERMVEPVPVNRFAARAVERTLPGIVCSLLWDEAYGDSSAPVQGIGMTRRFQPWWNSVAATLNPSMTVRIRHAYDSLVAGVNPVQAERQLADAAEDRWNLERQRMQMFDADFLTHLFTHHAMTSLRDVSTPVEFAGGSQAQTAIEHLLGTQSGSTEERAAENSESQ